MAKVDLSAYSLDELSALIDEATKLREGKIAARRQELMAELAALDGKTPAKAAKAATGTRASPPAKYRSHANEELTWTGRGGTPRWLKAESEETGKPIEAFLIK